MYTKLNSKGFASLGILVIVTLLAITAVGLLVFRDQNTREQADSSAPASDTSRQASDDATTAKEGTFTGVPPKTGSGSVSLVKNTDGTYTVQLADDFVVQKGPALFIGFANDGKVDHDTLFAELKSFSGKQEYSVPSTIDVSKYTQVMVYCEEFSVPFSVATLK